MTDISTRSLRADKLSLLPGNLTTPSVTSDKLLAQEAALMTTYYVVLMVLSMIANGIIGIVFYKKPQLLTVSNNFVLNLACCDMGLSVLVLPFAAASVCHGDWPLSAAWCRVESYLLVVLTVAMHYSLLAISLDRNYAIINSLRYPYIFTHRLGNSVIGATWALGFALGLPPLLGWGSFRYDAQQFLCSMDWNADTSYPVVLLVVVIIFPAVVQAWCYLSIFRAALGHTKRSSKVYPSSTTTTTTTNNNTTTTTTTTTSTMGDPATATASSSDSYDSSASLQTQTSRSVRAECKAVKTILLIGAAYLLCWTLFVVVAALRYRAVPVSPTLNACAVTLLFLSCTLNPLIYAFMNRATRYEIWRLWSRACHSLSGQPSPPFLDGENLPSSTWTATFSSSGRQSGGAGLWATPAQQRRSKSLAGCGTRNVEMIAIQEESETEDAAGQQIRHRASPLNTHDAEQPITDLVSDAALVQASSTTVPASSIFMAGVAPKLSNPADTAEEQSTKSSQIQLTSAGSGDTVLNPGQLSKLYSKPPDCCDCCDNLLSNRCFQCRH